MLRRRISYASLALIVLLAGCAPRNYPPELIPAATRLDATQKVNRLMDLAIDLEANGSISTPAATVIVKFCIAADQTIQAGTTDWKSTLKTSWKNVKDNNIIQPYLTSLLTKTAFSVVDALIGGL